MAMAENPLSQFRWKNRLIVVHLPDDRSGKAALKNLEEQVKRQRAEIRDRHLLLFHTGEFPGKTPSYAVKLTSDQAQVLHLRLDLSRNESQLLLIGNDGGIKARQRGGRFDLQKLFDLIDKMPMRREEMRNR